MKFSRTSISGLAAVVCTISGCAEHEIPHKFDSLKSIPRQQISREDFESHLLDYLSAYRAQRLVCTPQEAFDFLNSIWCYQSDVSLDNFDDWRSLAYSLRKSGGDCDDFAIAAGALLHDDGYKSRILAVDCKMIVSFFPPLSQKFCHALCEVEKGNKFSYIDLEGVHENFNSTKEFMEFYTSKHFLFDGYYYTLNAPTDGRDVNGEENLVSYYYDNNSNFQKCDLPLVPRGGDK